MPCIDINPMLDALEKRICDQHKAIAQVYGAHQAGRSLWIRGLTEKLWMTDLLQVNGWNFIATETYEPSDEPIEIEIYPPIIPTELWRNIDTSPANGADIRRRPV